MHSRDIVVEIWGKMACFTRPEAKVERLSYPIMTPTAAVGVLSAVYSKPVEFYWKIRKIEIMNPIRMQNIKVNEVKPKLKNKGVSSPIDINDTGTRTQRNMQVLTDVRYRVTAYMVARPEFATNKGIERLYSQAIRRLTFGQHYYMPYMGMSDFWANIELSESNMQPQDINQNLGMMILDLWTHEISEEIQHSCKECFQRQYFEAKIEHGVLTVPEEDSTIKERRGI